LRRFETVLTEVPASAATSRMLARGGIERFVVQPVQRFSKSFYQREGQTATGLAERCLPRWFVRWV
jgi:hypothetical protein